MIFSAKLVLLCLSTFLASAMEIDDASIQIFEATYQEFLPALKVAFGKRDHSLIDNIRNRFIAKVSSMVGDLAFVSILLETRLESEFPEYRNVNNYAIRNENSLTESDSSKQRQEDPSSLFALCSLDSKEGKHSDIPHYSDQNQMAIFKVVQNNDRDALRSLLKDVNMRDHNNRTPLMLACALGLYECARILIFEGKAELNAVDNKGNNALIIACSNGHLPLVAMLAEAGMDINIKNKSGTAIIMMAARRKNLVMVELLLSLNADFTVTDRLNNTLLHAAAAPLLPSEFDKFSAGLTNEQTAAKIVEFNGVRDKLIRRFLELGLDPNMRNNENKRAVDLVTEGQEILLTYIQLRENRK